MKHPSGFRRWSTTAPSCTPDQGNSHSSACVIYIHTCMEQKDCRRQINSAEEPAGTYYLKNLSLNWTVVVLLQSHPWQTVFENTQCTSSCLCIVRHCSLSVLHSTLGALNLYNLWKSACRVPTLPANRGHEDLTGSVFWEEGLAPCLRHRKSLLLYHQHAMGHITHSRTHSYIYLLGHHWTVFGKGLNCAGACAGPSLVT